MGRCAERSAARGRTLAATEKRQERLRSLEWPLTSVQSTGWHDSLSAWCTAIRKVAATPPRGWWGIPETRLVSSSGLGLRTVDGLFIEDLEFRVDQFRIPPRELGQMLPQQSLMLKVAAEAAKDARWDDRLALSTGVLIGIGLDLSTTNYHLRWSLAGQARRWNQSLALGLSEDELAEWIDAAQDGGRACTLGEPDDWLLGRHGRQPGCP